LVWSLSTTRSSNDDNCSWIPTFREVLNRVSFRPSSTPFHKSFRVDSIDQNSVNLSQPSPGHHTNGRSNMDRHTYTRHVIERHLKGVPRNIPRIEKAKRKNRQSKGMKANGV
jgi:hypothetical protein